MILENVADGVLFKFLSQRQYKIIQAHVTSYIMFQFLMYYFINGSMPYQMSRHPQFRN